MKIHNKKVAPPKPVTVVIYREDDDGQPANIVFKCAAVLSYEEYERLCPIPKPPLVTKKSTNESYSNTDDRRYKAAINNWSSLKVDWMMIQSLRATEGLEWEVVKYQDPETWTSWETELKEFLTESEYNVLVQGILAANSPSQNRRQEALDRFTVTQEQEVSEATSQVEEPTSTPSSEPANV